MTIVTIFAGRKANIEILKKYLEKALELKIIDEVHFWNNTRNISDENYLKTISNLKRSSSTNNNYILISPLIYENTFTLDVKATNDIHIKIKNIDTEYEIVLGGWNNTKSVIRENNNEIYSLVKNGIADKQDYITIEVKINNDMLNIKKNNELLMCQKIKNDFQIENVFFKTFHNSVGHLKYKETQNKGFYFMDTCEKNWHNYYRHYDDSDFTDDIIIKCDDDIVFIDIYKLPKFIEFIRNNNYDLVFANTINNGVSAYFQQNKYNLIPKEIMNLEYPPGGWCGSLWENGKKAEKLHNYFIENYHKFLNYKYDDEIIPINTRYSINFFGYKGKNWHKIRNCGNDDEHNLTIEYVNSKQFKNVLYSDFYVSHLSFYRQNETGINLNDLINKYENLYNLIH
jgi:hypothetical protein